MSVCLIGSMTEKNCIPFLCYLRKYLFIFRHESPQCVQLETYGTFTRGKLFDTEIT